PAVPGQVALHLYRLRGRRVRIDNRLDRVSTIGDLRTMPILNSQVLHPCWELEVGSWELGVSGAFRRVYKTRPALRCESSQKESVGRVVVLRRVGIGELVEERSKRRHVRVADFESGEHAAEVRAVIAVVEQADVPAATELLEKLSQRAGPLREFKSAEPFV